MQESASRRYSNALFQTGVEKNELDSYLKQIREVSDVMLKHKELLEFLKHPTIGLNDKTNVIKEIFKDFNEEIIKLLLLLIDHGRLSELHIIAEDYHSLVNEFKGIKTAYATTAAKMTDDEIKLLKEKLSKSFNYNFEIINLIETEVIGGVYLKIGDMVIDGTIKGRIDGMRKELFKEGSEVIA